MSFSKDEYEALIGSPGWAAMKRYLLDYRSSLADKIAEGNIPAAEIQLTIARCQTAKDLAEMDWPTIAKFYDIPLTEEKHES